MTREEARLAVLVELIRKSGVREWTDAATREQISRSAVQIADFLWLAPNANWNPGAPPSGGGVPGMTTRKILIPEMDGTPKQIWFASASGNSITAANDLRDATSGNRTFAAITLASLANSTSESTGARQSAKVDLGSIRPPYYRVAGVFEIAATPTAGNVIEVWWAPSSSSTAGNGNTGGASGTDASYTGYSSNITASLRQCQYIGEFIVTAQATTTKQIGRIGLFAPSTRYGSLILWNKSGAALHSTDTEMHVVFDPVFPQGQTEV